MSRHAEAVLAVTEQGSATSLIATSWRRCATAHRLDPDNLRIPERDASALGDAEERDEKLISLAAPYLDQLFEAVGDPEGSATLSDRHGLMTRMRVGGSHAVFQRRPWRRLGVNFAEAQFGTNGIGTCLAEERSVVVTGEDHYALVLTGTTCFAAPIFGPDGRIVGCLNAAATRQRGREIATFAQMAVKSFAKRVEVELFAVAFAGARFVLASDAGRHPGALLAVDEDGLVMGATRAARRLLDLEPEDLERGLDLETLRGCGASERLIDTERKLVARALARHGGNVSRAAKSLGISRSTFYRKAGPLRMRE